MQDASFIFLQISTMTLRLPFRPQPHRVDARSLAAFRILLSIYILHDIYRRLEHGRLSLAWYYSDDLSSADGYFLPPILDPTDSPHGSPVHKLWFYRGSPELQIAIFAMTAFLAVLFGIGLNCQRSSILLWLFMNGLQNRSPHLADGSDLYLRNMLLWCTVCPIGRVWSYDAIAKRRGMVRAASIHKKNDDYNQEGTNVSVSTTSGRNDQANPYIVQSIGSLGCTLQVGLMYYGAVYRRFAGRMWMWPDLTAVFYVMNNGFATRQWAADLIRGHPQLSRYMTGAAMIAELTCPAACLLASCDGNSWRHIPAILLMLFHLSLFACMRLFNWQFMSILCCIIFIPSNVWDRLQLSEEASLPKTQDGIGNKSLGGKIRKVFSSFFVVYMAYNWCGERRWIAKHDNGDIGEFLRFNQNWLMYGPDVSRTTMATLITGKVQGDEIQSKNSTDSNLEPRRLDIFKAIRDNEWGGSSEIDHSTYMFMRYEETPGDMAARFPSWRWEVSLKDWVKERVKPRSMTPARRSKRLGHVLCVAANDARKGYTKRITHVELAFWSMRTVDFGEASMEHRFDRSRDDLVVEVEC